MHRQMVPHIHVCGSTEISELSLIGTYCPNKGQFLEPFQNILTICLPTKQNSVFFYNGCCHGTLIAPFGL